MCTSVFKVEWLDQNLTYPYKNSKNGKYNTIIKEV